MWDMTRLYMGHDTFIRGTWVIHMWNIRSYVQVILYIYIYVHIPYMFRWYARPHIYGCIHIWMYISLWTYMVYVHIYGCICTYVHIYRCTNVHIYGFAYHLNIYGICTYIYGICTYIWMYIPLEHIWYMYIYMDIQMYTCMDVHITWAYCAVESYCAVNTFICLYT